MQYVDDLFDFPDWFIEHLEGLSKVYPEVKILHSTHYVMPQSSIFITAYKKDEAKDTLRL